jgi:hypothetical protein
MHGEGERMRPVVIAALHTVLQRRATEFQAGHQENAGDRIDAPY